MARWIEVLLDVPLNQSFTYEAPEKGCAEVGMRAEVYFGKRRMKAYIVAVHDKLPQDIPVDEGKIKKALRLIDSEKLFDEEFVALAKWLSSFYLCAPGEALAAMLPSGRREVKAAADAFIDDASEYAAHALSDEQSKAVAEICASFGAEGAGNDTNAEKTNQVSNESSTSGTNAESTQTPTDNANTECAANTENAQALADGANAESSARTPSGASPAGRGTTTHAVASATRGTAQAECAQASAGGASIESSARAPNGASPAERGAAQASAPRGASLHYLYGSTGSGKTEVFLQCAEKALSRGKGVIYLVPEIALTRQVTESVVARFGKTAAVLHSGLTPSQKLGEWRRIRRREARVVIGARSAVFAPVPNLGLIIIDEEHDGSYKSGNTPRYHARQVAIKRCNDLRIPLVMGSATPSVEAWQLIGAGVIARHTLTKRLAGGKEPEISVVNLSNIKLDGCISPQLASEIAAAKSEGRQTILFLNRRGFTHFFRCNTCGFELKCKNCSVALTFHKSESRLRCHYCGWSLSPPKSCPECGSLDIGYSGFGTEFIESEIAAKFPQMKAIRIDTDSLTKRGELHEKLADFKSGKADILLGTQMVAKGLNFPGVKLVGIINADTGLNMPDFRAAERTFALIVQVAGRAGRFFPDGKVVVQSWCPQRNAIADACGNNIEGFYANEIVQRKMLMFPPFSRLVRLVFRAKQQSAAQSAAESAASLMRQIAPQAEILGPAECPLALISNNYRYQLLLRGAKLQALQKLCAAFLATFKAPAGVYIETDVDPVNLL